MGTFTWPKDSPDALTFIVSEMSRTAALACARDFNVILASNVYKDPTPLLMELEVLAAIYAPTVIKTQEGGTYHDYTLTYEGEQISIKIPMEPKDFDKLPYSLTKAWIETAVNANDWLIDDLKNGFRRIAQMTAASPSGNGQSSELTEIPQTTKTIGIPDIPIGS